MAAESMIHTKKDIRAIMTKKRRDLDEEKRRIFDRIILNTVLKSDAYKRCDILLTYASYNGEADTWALMNKALSDGKTVGCPICRTDNDEPTMDFYRIEGTEALIPGYKGIPEPDKHLTVKIKPYEISRALIIVPLVAYDRDRNRVGYGKGFYDRFLSANDHLYSTGLAYSLQEYKSIPADEYDIKPDMIITEKGIC